MAATATATATLPQTGVWDLDPTHSSLEFSARHLMATRVRGRFSDWTATLTTGSAPGDAQVEAEVKVGSVTTFNEGRDKHLRTSDFFDVDNHPTMTFRSTGVGELRDDNHFELRGELTARGVTKPVTVDAEFLGALQDPFGNTKVTFSATAELDRDAWGISWNQPLQNGGLLVSKTIKVEVEAQFVLRKDAAQQSQ